MPENEQLNETGGGVEETPSQSPPPLDKNQKIAVAGLVVFAVLVVVLWVVQLRSNIYGPFNAPVGSSQVAQTGADDQAAKDAALKTKDTDGDGLSDYDELNIYNTSPYLEDTDGDGFKDSEEIKNNADPNCPAGRDCAGGLLDNPAVDQSASTPDASSDTLNSLLNQFGATEPTAQPAGGADSLSPDQLNVLKNIDAASLRQLLIEAGMPKETLDKISDIDLMQSYGETFSNGL